MWANESVFYQIYPFGACGAPFENDHVLEHRIHKLEDFIPHLKNIKKIERLKSLDFAYVFSCFLVVSNTNEY